MERKKKDFFSLSLSCPYYFTHHLQLSYVEHTGREKSTTTDEGEKIAIQQKGGKRKYTPPLLFNLYLCVEGAGGGRPCRSREGPIVTHFFFSFLHSSQLNKHTTRMEKEGGGLFLSLLSHFLFGSYQHLISPPFFPGPLHKRLCDINSTPQCNVLHTTGCYRPGDVYGDSWQNTGRTWHECGPNRGRTKATLRVTLKSGMMISRSQVSAWRGPTQPSPPFPRCKEWVGVFPPPIQFPVLAAAGKGRGIGFFRWQNRRGSLPVGKGDKWGEGKIFFRQGWKKELRRSFRLSSDAAFYDNGTPFPSSTSLSPFLPLSLRPKGACQEWWWWFYPREAPNSSVSPLPNERRRCRAATKGAEGRGKKERVEEEGDQRPPPCSITKLVSILRRRPRDCLPQPSVERTSRQYTCTRVWPLEKPPLTVLGSTVESDCSLYLFISSLTNFLSVSAAGKTMAIKYGVKYIETSPGINHNVDELLVGMLTQIKLRIAEQARQQEMQVRAYSRSDTTVPTQQCS